MEKKGSIDFPNSLGFLWEKFSKYLGFSEYDACKVMGLASYGNPNTFDAQFKQLIDIKSDGTFTINDKIVMLRNEDYTEIENLLKTEGFPLWVAAKLPEVPSTKC